MADCLMRLSVDVRTIVFAGLAQAETSFDQAKAEYQSIAEQQFSASVQAPLPGGRAKGAVGVLSGAAKGKSKANQYGDMLDEIADESVTNAVHRLDGNCRRRGKAAPAIAKRLGQCSSLQRLYGQQGGAW